MLLRKFYVQENEKGKGFIVRNEERSQLRYHSP